MKLIYIAAPFFAMNDRQERINIKLAERAGAWVAEHACMPIIPAIAITDQIYPEQFAGFWRVCMLDLLRRCDAVMLIRHCWSKFVDEALWTAKDNGIPHYVVCQGWKKNTLALDKQAERWIENILEGTS